MESSKYVKHYLNVNYFCQCKQIRAYQNTVNVH